MIKCEKFSLVTRCEEIYQNKPEKREENTQHINFHIKNRTKHRIRINIFQKRRPRDANQPAHEFRGKWRKKRQRQWQQIENISQKFFSCAACELHQSVCGEGGQRWHQKRHTGVWQTHGAHTKTVRQNVAIVWCDEGDGVKLLEFFFVLSEQAASGRKSCAHTHILTPSAAAESSFLFFILSSFFLLFFVERNSFRLREKFLSDVFCMFYSMVCRHRVPYFLFCRENG